MSCPLRNSDRREMNRKQKFLKSIDNIFPPQHFSKPAISLFCYFIIFSFPPCHVSYASAHLLPSINHSSPPFLHIFSFVNLLEQLEMKEFILIQWNGLIRIHTPSFGFFTLLLQLSSFFPFMLRDTLLRHRNPSRESENVKVSQFTFSIVSVEQCSRNFLIKEFNSPARQDNLFQSSLYIEGIKRTLLA